VRDCSWNQGCDLLIASVEEGQGNSIHFWKMVNPDDQAKYLYEN
jgi:hypothetical protein